MSCAASRIASGRQPEPTAAVIDSQSIKAAEEVSVPPGSHGALAGIATARPGTRHQRHAQARILHGLRCDQLSLARTHDHAEAALTPADTPGTPAQDPQRQPGWLNDKLRAVKAPENRGALLKGPPNAAIDPTASRAIGSISAGFRGSYRLEPMTWRIKTWTW